MNNLRGSHDVDGAGCFWGVILSVAIWLSGALIVVALFSGCASDPNAAQTFHTRMVVPADRCSALAPGFMQACYDTRPSPWPSR